MIVNEEFLFKNMFSHNSGQLQIFGGNDTKKLWVISSSMEHMWKKNWEDKEFRDFWNNSTSVKEISRT